MNCIPAEIEIKRLNYARPITYNVHPNEIQRILKAAYQVINDVYYLPDYRKNVNIQRSLSHNFGIWESGHNVIYQKSRILPVALMRQIVAYHLYMKGVVLRRIAEYIGATDHTTALHNKNVFQRQLSLKHQTIEKELWQRFQNEIS